MYYLFIAHENDKWCRFVVHIGSLSLISLYCMCFVSFCFFLFFLVFLWVLLLAVLGYWAKFCDTWKKAVELFLGSFLREAPEGELLQLYLEINISGLVEPIKQGSVWEKF